MADIPSSWTTQKDPPGAVRPTLPGSVPVAGTPPPLPGSTPVPASPVPAFWTDSARIRSLILDYFARNGLQAAQELQNWIRSEIPQG